MVLLAVCTMTGDGVLAAEEQQSRSRYLELLTDGMGAADAEAMRLILEGSFAYTDRIAAITSSHASAEAHLEVVSSDLESADWSKVCLKPIARKYQDLGERCLDLAFRFGRESEGLEDVPFDLVTDCPYLQTTYFNCLADSIESHVGWNLEGPVVGPEGSYSSDPRITIRYCQLVKEAILRWPDKVIIGDNCWKVQRAFPRHLRDIASIAETLGRIDVKKQALLVLAEMKNGNRGNGAASAFS
jgi:hypothetical protein